MPPGHPKEQDHLGPNERCDVSIAHRSQRDAVAELSCVPRRIRSLRIWFCGIKSYHVLSRFRSLRTLVVSDWLAPDLKVLPELKQLRRLLILHLPNVKDLEPLARCRRLELLELETLPSWDGSGRGQCVATLRPLAKLQRLRTLALRGVFPRDRSLKVLSALTSLRNLTFSDDYPLAAMAALAIRRPDLGLTAIRDGMSIKCPTCCGEPAILLGLKGTRRRRFVCHSCNSGLVAKHAAEFARLKDADRRGNRRAQTP